MEEVIYNIYMKNFVVDKEFWEMFPGAVIGVLALSEVKETGAVDEAEAEEIRQLLAKANREAEKYLVSDVISENPVVRVWRQAYQKFPTKKGARCSIEALLKRVLHGKPVGTIFPPVDITNAISLKYALPIGVEDVDKLDGDLRLGVMKGDERFLPIGSEVEELPLAGEVAYYDNYGAVCRCFNWRDGQRTEVTDGTTNEVVLMECVDPARVDDLKAAVTELSELMQKYLEAKVVSLEFVDAQSDAVRIGE